MPESLEGYLTKIELSEIYRRSKRQITRDLSAAVRTQNNDVLKHTILNTEEGNVPGTEVTLDLIDKLIEQRQNPTWYISKDYAPTLCKVGDKAQPDESAATPNRDVPVKPSVPAQATTTVNASYQQALLEQIAELKRDKETLQSDKGNLLEIIDSLTEQNTLANERSRETNLLMRDLHQLLASEKSRELTDNRSIPQSTPKPATTDEQPKHEPSAHAKKTPNVSQPKKVKPKSSKPRARTSKSRKSGQAAKPTTKVKKTTSPSEKNLIDKMFPTFKAIVTKSRR